MFFLLLSFALLVPIPSMIPLFLSIFLSIPSMIQFNQDIDSLPYAGAAITLCNAIIPNKATDQIYKQCIQSNHGKQLCMILIGPLCKVTHIRPYLQLAKMFAAQFFGQKMQNNYKEDGKNLIRNNADNQEYLANFAPLMFQPF